MRVTTIIKLLLLCVSLAGLINIGLLIKQPDLTQTTIQNDTTTLSQTNPLDVYFAVLSLGILLSLLIWQLAGLWSNKLYKRYKSLDSNSLDANQTLASEFYRSAIDYRVKYGSRRFKSGVIKKFDFFYDYHNHALKWIDEVVTLTQSHSVPYHFIQSVIASGHIGQVFTRVHYANGLIASNLKMNAPIILHDCAETIELWSYHSHHALAKINKDSVQLQTAHRHPNYIAAFLTGVESEHKTKQQIELRFLTAMNNKRKQGRSENAAKHNLLELQKWLNKASKTTYRHQINNGIEVSEIVTASSSIYSTPLMRSLEQLVYSKIDAFFPRSKLPLTDQKIALDAVVLCNGIGIIAVIEKLEQGVITYSGDTTWYQYIGDNTVELKNPCQQARQARAALGNLLATYNLTRWPVLSLVVYSKDNIELNLTMGTKKLQCEVVKLSGLERWIKSKRKEEGPEFNQRDIAMFNAMIEQHPAFSNAV